MDQGRQLGGERRVGEGGRMRGRQRVVVFDEIRATIIDYIVNHDLALRD